MAGEFKRAEVVADDEMMAERLREFLQHLDYDVEVNSSRTRASDRHDVDIIVYHVSEAAVRAERRSRARTRRGGSGASAFWLDRLHEISASAPAVPVIVALPPGEDPDKALDSGATDVIEHQISSKALRRRLEMVELYSQKMRSLYLSAGGLTLDGAAWPTRPDRGVLLVPLPELRSDSGRLDAFRVADYLGISLKNVAAAIGRGYAGIHKTPDSAGIQAALLPIVRILELADAALGDRPSVLKWMNRPLPELENDSPLAVILAGESDAVLTLLQNVRAGVPG